VSVGDGFSTPCSAQDTTALTGKILRLEVRDLPPGPGGPPARGLVTPAGNPFVAHPNANARLVWAMGFRNPFRFHVDVGNGALLVGDVGQFTWEEVNYVTAPGVNHGWPLYEGPDPYSTCPGVADAGFEKGIYWYGGGQSVITAGVHRRAASRAGNFPSGYEGDAFVSDYYDGGLRRLKRGEASWDVAPPVPGQPTPMLWATGLQNVSDYAQAPDGTLWYVKQSVAGGANTGQIRRIRYAGALGADGPGGRGLALAAPAPNPARGGVRFAYALATDARVELCVFDAAGRRVAMPFTATRPAGTGEAVWDARGPRGEPCPPGLYFAVLRAGGETHVRRFVLAR
jgi:glucose/arabinose dehydrogenase